MLTRILDLISCLVERETRQKDEIVAIIISMMSVLVSENITTSLYLEDFCSKYSGSSQQ